MSSSSNTEIQTEEIGNVHSETQVPTPIIRPRTSHVIHKAIYARTHRKLNLISLLLIGGLLICFILSFTAQHTTSAILSFVSFINVPCLCFLTWSLPEACHRRPCIVVACMQLLQTLLSITTIYINVHDISLAYTLVSSSTTNIPTATPMMMPQLNIASFVFVFLIHTSLVLICVTHVSFVINEIRNLCTTS